MWVREALAVREIVKKNGKDWVRPSVLRSFSSGFWWVGVGVAKPLGSGVLQFCAILAEWDLPTSWKGVMRQRES
ncbi:hypothetical protein E2542_SST10181 [Spatholobus suberectus]|nr:hypothetical protein E2542_SST10181 [Spatholobus suberectus]